MYHHRVTSKSLFFAAMVFCAAPAMAQNKKPVAVDPSNQAPSTRSAIAITTPTTTTAPLPISRCETCKYSVPAEVQTTAKDAVVISGPPDGKGAPVEYQVFVQMTAGAAWTLAARGEIIKPGERHPYCFANSSQVMVLVWSDTPFGSIAEFSDSCN
ncbi:MAG: hypothetical protein ACKVU2_08670 [Saprospiraceae bacterium]